jgi:hypothetical protein
MNKKKEFKEYEEYKEVRVTNLMIDRRPPILSDDRQMVERVEFEGALV